MKPDDFCVVSHNKKNYNNEFGLKAGECKKQTVILYLSTLYWEHIKVEDTF